MRMEDLRNAGVERLFADMEEHMSAGKHYKESEAVLDTWFSNTNISLDAFATMVESDAEIATELEGRHPGLSQYFAKATRYYETDQKLKGLRCI